MTKLFIITGEYSGNMHGAEVAKQLKISNPDIQIEGIGADAMESEGVKLFANHAKMGAVGLSPKILKEHIELGKNVVNYILNDYKPDFVLLIDYGGFNMKIAKFLKEKGFSGKIFYYIPPQVWASRKYRIKAIKKYIDKVFCIFPFEVDMYKEFGIDVHYCGHPLISQLPPPTDKKTFFEKHGLNPAKPLISVFPGSRKFELAFLMKLFIKSAQTLKRKHPDLQVCFSQAPNISDELYYKYFEGCDFKVIKGENHSLLSTSDALILASGTVALEAALYNTPMIISYKGPWFFYLVYRLVRCLDKVSLPNIICNKIIVPELIQHLATHDNIVFETEKLLYDKQHRASQIAELSEVNNKLSSQNSSLEVAKVILKELTN